LSQGSYLSANDPRLHFGLGALTTTSVEVRWPSGLIEKFNNVKAGQLLTLLEGKGPVVGRSLRSP
jgi:hypothetical protein